MEGVEVLRAHGIVESQRADVVVQEHADSSQVWWRVNGHLFAVVANHPGVVTTTKHPRKRVLPNPLMLGCWLIGDAHCIPETKNSPVLWSRVSFIVIGLLSLSIMQLSSQPIMWQQSSANSHADTCQELQVKFTRLDWVFQKSSRITQNRVRN